MNDNKKLGAFAPNGRVRLCKSLISLDKIAVDINCFSGTMNHRAKRTGPRWFPGPFKTGTSGVNLMTKVWIVKYVSKSGGHSGFSVFDHYWEARDEIFRLKAKGFRVQLETETR